MSVTVTEAAPNERHQEAKPPLLSVSGLKVSFTTRGGTVEAINDVSFHVNLGEILGIVGESGSGKSVASFSVLGILVAEAYRDFNWKEIIRGDEPA